MLDRSPRCVVSTGLPERAERTRLSPELRQRQILTAARDVFLESGYARATIKEIAKAAGLTSPSVYAHFASKEEIYQRAVQEPLQELVTVVRDQMNALALQPGTSRQEVLERANEAFLAAMTQMAPLLAVTIVAQPEQSRAFYISTVWPQLHQAIEAVLDVVFAGAQPDAEIATLGFLGVHYSVVMGSLLQGKPLDIVQAATQITALFQRAIHPEVPVARPVSPIPTRRRERMPGHERRQVIIAAAQETFLEKGVTATRIKDVAQRAGLTEPGLYAHFSSKDELYHAAVQEPLERLVSRFAAATAQLAGEIEAVHPEVNRTDADRATLRLRANRLLLDCLIELAPLLTVALFSEMEPGRQLYRAVLLPKLEQATLTMVSAYEPNAPRIELQRIAEAMVSMNFGLALDSFMRGRLIDLHDAPAYVMQIQSEPASVSPRPLVNDSGPAPKPLGVGQSAVGARSRRRLPATERRQLIIEAARQVFCELSSSRASLKEVARRAGVTEPAVYQHFESRDELYRIAVEDHVTGLFELAAVQAAEIGADTTLDRTAKLTALDALYLRLMIDTTPLSAVSFFEAAGRGKDLYQNTIAGIMARTANPLHQLLMGSDLPAESEGVVVMSLFGIHFGVALDAMLRGTSVDVEQMTARITAVFR